MLLCDSQKIILRRLIYKALPRMLSQPVRGTGMEICLTKSNKYGTIRVATRAWYGDGNIPA